MVHVPTENAPKVNAPNATAAYQMFGFLISPRMTSPLSPPLGAGASVAPRFACEGITRLNTSMPGTRTAISITQ